MSIVKKEVTVHFVDKDGIKSERKEMREFNEIEINGNIFSVMPGTKKFTIPRENRAYVGQVVIYDVYDLSKDVNPDIMETYEEVVTQEILDFDKITLSGIL